MAEKKNPEQNKRMTRAEAASILKIDSDANEYEVRAAHNRRSISMRGRTDKASFDYLELVNEAFDVMMGIDRAPAYEPAVFGDKTETDIKTFWHYNGKWFIIGGIIIVILVWMIFSSRTSTSPDFLLGIYGDFFKSSEAFEEDYTLLEDVILQDNPEIDRLVLELNVISLHRTDHEMRSGSAVKRTLMATGANINDVMIVDRTQFELLGVEGVFYPLDDLDSILQKDFPELYGTWIRPLSFTVDKEYLPANWEEGEHVYGFSFGSSQAINSLEIAGQEHILTISYHSEQAQLSKQVIYNLLANIDEWYKPEQAPVSYDSLDPDTDSISYRLNQEATSSTQSTSDED